MKYFDVPVLIRLAQSLGTVPAVIRVKARSKTAAYQEATKYPYFDSHVVTP